MSHTGAKMKAIPPFVLLAILTVLVGCQAEPMPPNPAASDPVAQSSDTRAEPLEWNGETWDWTNETAFVLLMPDHPGTILTNTADTDSRLIVAHDPEATGRDLRFVFQQYRRFGDTWQLDGTTELEQADGEIERRTYSRGQAHGEQLVINPDGSTRFHRQWINGELIDP